MFYLLGPTTLNQGSGSPLVVILAFGLGTIFLCMHTTSLFKIEFLFYRWFSISFWKLSFFSRKRFLWSASFLGGRGTWSTEPVASEVWQLPAQLSSQYLRYTITVHKAVSFPLSVSDLSNRLPLEPEMPPVDYLQYITFTFQYHEMECTFPKNCWIELNSKSIIYIGSDHLYSSDFPSPCHAILDERLRGEAKIESSVFNLMKQLVLSSFQVSGERLAFALLLGGLLKRSKTSSCT